MKKLEEAKNELEAKYGIRVLPVQADVCAGTDNEATVQNVVNQAVDTFGGIQVLVNNGTGIRFRRAAGRAHHRAV